MIFKFCTIVLNFTKISAQGMKLNSSEITVHLLFTKLYCTVLMQKFVCLDTL